MQMAGGASQVGRGREGSLEEVRSEPSWKEQDGVGPHQVLWPL